jgi:hypothetical protein
MENSSIEKGGYQNTKKEAREYYAKINRVWCLRLASFVIFDRAGFQHLIRRGKIPRPKSEQKRRFALLPRAVEMLNNPDAHIFYKKKVFENGEAEFWIFKQTVNKTMISVVLRRIGNGNIHFFSVYQNKNPS